MEADVRVQSAQELCDEIKKVHPGQHVAFVCNYRVAIDSDCPDEIIRAEFNPEALVRGVKEALEINEDEDNALRLRPSVSRDVGYADLQVAKPGTPGGAEARFSAPL